MQNLDNCNSSASPKPYFKGVEKRPQVSFAIAHSTRG